MLGLNRPALHLLGERSGTHRGPVKGKPPFLNEFQQFNFFVSSRRELPLRKRWAKDRGDFDERRHAMPQDEYFMLASFGSTNCASAFEMLPPQAAVLRERLPAVQPILGCVSHAHYLAGSTSSPAGLNNTSRGNIRHCHRARPVIHPVLLLNHRQRWLGNGASADCFSPRHGCAFDWAWFGRSRCAVRALVVDVGLNRQWI
ncbi:hypothetical protein B0H14DRAFT_3153081 [Mycena olivaceomarginata]|nr:hypothetical protein B0H14DRAFT_3153081 [Mycena olivaceomarginata]